MESDWKKFRAMVPELRERYLAKRNARIAGMLTASGKDETDRFWSAMEEMEKEAMILRRCLDGHSRSKMFHYIIAMFDAGMMTKEDLLEFSQELQNYVSDVVKPYQARVPTQP